jgi:glutamate racemase
MTTARTVIGVFDSGLGGLTVLEALRRALPRQDFMYLGDNGNAPYGVRSPQEIKYLTRKAVERLFAEGCGLVLIACNTASALALRELQQDWLPTAAPDNRVLGVFVPLIEALTGRGWREAPGRAPLSTAAFFATPATVKSGAFTREAKRLAPALTIIEQDCPGLVNAIEAGEPPDAFVQRAVEAALKRGVPQAALLGCTHYPHAIEAFRAALPSGTPILSQPQIVAESLAAYLKRHPQFRGGTGWLDCVTTGDPEHVSARAEALFGRALPFDPA